MFRRGPSSRASRSASGPCQRARGDRGTVLAYALAGVLLVMAVALVMADTSSLFMRRTALMIVADEAAIAAANAIDVDALYDSGVGSVLVLDPQLARQYAQASVDRVDDARLSDVRLDEVQCDSGRVAVVVSAAVPPALSGIPGLRNVRLRAGAAATTPTRA